MHIYIISLLNIALLLSAPFLYGGRRIYELDSFVLEVIFILLVGISYFAYGLFSKPLTRTDSISNKKLLSYNRIIFKICLVYFVSCSWLLYSDQFSLFQFAERRLNPSLPSYAGKLVVLFQGAPLIGLALQLVLKKRNMCCNAWHVIFYIISTAVVFLFGGRSTAVFSVVYVMVVCSVLGYTRFLILILVACIPFGYFLNYIVLSRINLLYEVDIDKIIGLFDVVLDKSIFDYESNGFYLAFFYIVQSMFNIESVLSNGNDFESSDGFFSFFLLARALGLTITSPNWYVDGAYYGLVGEFFFDFGLVFLVFSAICYGIFVRKLQIKFNSKSVGFGLLPFLLYVFLITAYFFHLNINFLVGFGLSFLVTLLLAFFLLRIKL